MMKYPQAHSQPIIVPAGIPMVTSAVGPSNDHPNVQSHQSWMSKNPMMEHLMVGTKDSLDDSLTSLNWLQNMNLSIGESTPPISPRVGVAGNESMRVNPNQVLATNLKQNACHLMDIQTEALDANLSMDKIDYKTNPYIKPPYSYATLICMAMKSSKKSKMTLSAIYNWITEHFMYYRMADPSWQNSIRHNLSLNKCFQKVPRKKDEPGKGGFWRINPEYSALLDNGVLKKKCKAIESRSKRPSDDSDPASGMRKKPRKSADEDAEAALSLEEYLNFDRYLSQDIEVGGIKLRTEDIIDGQSTDNRLVDLSPPLSSDDTSDSFEDLLSCNLSHLEPSATGQSEMTIQGVKIEPPEWWTESLNGNAFSGLLNNSNPSGSLSSHNHTSHPWTSDKSDIDDAMAALDDVERFLCSSFN